MSCFACLKRQPSSAGGPENGAVQNSAKPADLKPDDPRIPLNTRQKFTLSKNWKGISREASTTGTAMFERLFDQNDHLYDLFGKISKELKGKSKEEHLNSETLQEHADAVMNVFDDAVKYVDNADQLFALLTTVAQQHAVRAGFKPDYFWLMEEPFLYAVKLTLADRYTDNMENIYKTVIHLLLEKMVEEAAKEQTRLGIDPGGSS